MSSTPEWPAVLSDATRGSYSCRHQQFCYRSGSTVCIYFAYISYDCEMIFNTGLVQPRTAQIFPTRPPRAPTRARSAQLCFFFYRRAACRKGPPEDARAARMFNGQDHSKVRPWHQGALFTRTGRTIIYIWWYTFSVWVFSHQKKKKNTRTKMKCRDTAWQVRDYKYSRGREL